MLQGMLRTCAARVHDLQTDVHSSQSSGARRRKKCRERLGDDIEYEEDVEDRNSLEVQVQFSAVYRDGLICVCNVVYV